MVPGALRFARMAGSSIAAPAAAWWVTDFLNAAYYARRDEERDVRDLRLAHGILTTRWSRHGDRRLGARDIVALHRAYGAHRLRRRGRLDHAALLEGAAALIGDWFPAAWADDARRAHGIAFPTIEERDAFAPEARMACAARGELTPPLREPVDQHWATYDPVPLPDAGAALAFPHTPRAGPTWRRPTAASPRCAGDGLPGQTFEIEVVAEPTPRSPVFTRGYVTCTQLDTVGAGLEAAVADLADRFRASAGADARPLLPDDAEPLALVVLTTHAGHFLGRGALAPARLAGRRRRLHPRRRRLGSPPAAPRRRLRERRPRRPAAVLGPGAA